MKKIILEIEDEIVAELKSSVIAKHICASFYGTADEFITLLVKAIEAGNKKVTILRKKKRRKKKKKKKKAKR